MRNKMRNEDVFNTERRKISQGRCQREIRQAAQHCDDGHTEMRSCKGCTSMTDSNKHRNIIELSTRRQFRRRLCPSSP